MPAPDVDAWLDTDLEMNECEMQWVVSMLDSWLWSAPRLPLYRRRAQCNRICASGACMNRTTGRKRFPQGARYAEE